MPTLGKTVTGSARQLRAGAPIQIQQTIRLTNPAHDEPGYVGIGVTTSSTPPATYGDFTHKDASLVVWSASPYSGYQDWRGRSLSSDTGTTVAPFADSYALRREQALDSNYVAGRYLWFIFDPAATPSSGSAPDALKGPYHIR
jgi:hypothetical protein